MRLKKLFLLTTGLVLTLVSAMLLRAVVSEWKIYVNAEKGLSAMEIAFLAMKAAEKASFERGPTIGVLGDGMGQNPQARERLVKARSESDSALQLAINAISSRKVSVNDISQKKLFLANEQLVQARLKAEAAAALPVNQRSPDAAMSAIDEMFKVVDTIFEAVTLLSVQAEAAYPDLSDALASARLAAEMREASGRLGSQFTSAISGQEKLAERQLKNITRYQAKIEQLLRLIEIRTTARQANPVTANAMANLKARYFETRLPFIESLTTIGKNDGKYNMTTPQFVARYVPEMKSIVELRDVMIDEAIAGSKEKHRDAKQSLVFNITLGIAVFLIEICVFLMIRRRVLKPLIDTTQLLNSLSVANHEALKTKIQLNRRDEIGDMQRAAAMLQDLIQQKQTLEQDRESLIKQLERAASLDHLTGLHNRRAFEDCAKRKINTSIAKHWEASIIIFDLDHFKNINDVHGHTAGDAVLAEVAMLAQSNFRANDTVCRYGGEEFIVIAEDCGQNQAIKLAERLRMAISKHDFLIAQVTPIKVTASFGVSTLKVTTEQDLAGLIKNADQALYQAKVNGRNAVRSSCNALEPA